MLWDSFFDETSERSHTFKIWRSCKEDPKQSFLLKEKVIKKGVLLKEEKKEGNSTEKSRMSERIFVLTNKHLLYKKVAVS